MCGGGRTLRDPYGRIIFSFSSYFGKGTNLQAKLKAVLAGANMCQFHGLSQFQIEYDSLVLVKVLQKHFTCPWSDRKDVEHIWQLTSGIPEINHCLRQANKVADLLENVGVSHTKTQQIIYAQDSDLSHLTHVEMIMDKFGFLLLEKFNLFH